MTKKAFIVSTENKILVADCSKDECSTCTAECNKKHTVFEVSNPKGYELKTGMTVIISVSKLTQALQAFISLFIPFFCSILGYVFAPEIMNLFGKKISDDARAIFVILFLFISSLIIFIIARFFPMPGKLHIQETL